MRGTIGIRLHNTNINNATRNTLVKFSTSSGSGGGGRGGGSGRGSSGPGLGAFGSNERAPGKPLGSSDSKSEAPDTPIPPPGAGRGHGRGRPVAPPSGLPSYSSFMLSLKQPSAGRGRGATGPSQSQTQHGPQQQPDSEPKKPVFFKSEEGVGADAGVSPDDDVSTPEKPVIPSSLGEILSSKAGTGGDHQSDQHLPGGVLDALSGIGRGKHMKEPDLETKVTEENRHLRTRRAPGAPAPAAASSAPQRQPKLSRDEAVKNARRILSQGEDQESDGGRGRGFRERGGFGGGRGQGRGRGRGRGGFIVRDLDEEAEDKEDAVFVGDSADGEKFAKKVGPEIMNQLAEGFEEIIYRATPSPLDDEIVEAFGTNCAIEFEPEYLMGEFDQNPDIDEKEPIPLRDALEKVKPFLMAYEGIQSQEEWEEVMEETMARVPLLQKIVDYYGGPDRVTAKKQQEELERVARTLPKSAPSSVKQFTNRAVISLQSNPGWEFDKKCHFMNKLVWEVSQHYK